MIADASDLLRSLPDHAAAAKLDPESLSSVTPADADLENGIRDAAIAKLVKQGSAFTQSVSFRAGLQIAFRDIQLKLVKKKTWRGRPGSVKTILNGVSGMVKPGRLTALLGPTGSGKTSLLNVLAARTLAIPGLELTGAITVGGKPVLNWPQYRRESAYVEQDDLLFSNLTVKETITLAAELRLPREMSYQEKMERVEAVIQELGLKRTVDTVIGNAKVRGISGGERKRVSIAVEILRQPGVFFLDEPTSGLDAFQALRVITTVKDLATQGRTIVASVHQPRSAIFALFDDVLVLSEGKIMYQGKAADLSGYLESTGHPLPKDFNPADYALDLFSLDLRTDELEKQTRKRLDQFHASYNALSTANLSQVSPAPMSSTLADIETRRKFEAPYLRQFILLSQRAWRQKRRDKRQVVIPFFMSVFFGLLLGFIYFRTGYDLSQKAIQDKVGLIFFLVVNQAFMGLLGTVSVFPIERDIVTRERGAGSYAVSPYFISKILVDLPSLFFPFLMTTICYWLAALSTSGANYIILCITTMLTYEASAALGLFLSAATNSAEAAMGMGQPVQLVFMLFSGFYANTSLIPAALAWIQWISPVRYAFGSAIVNEFTGLNFTCTAGSITGCVQTGNAEIIRLSLNEDTIGRNLGVLLGLTVAFFGLGYAVMRCKRIKWLEPVPAKGKEM